MHNKPTMQEKYDALSAATKDIIDTVTAAWKRQGAEWAQAEFARLCEEYKVKRWEAGALGDMIRWLVTPAV